MVPDSLGSTERGATTPGRRPNSLQWSLRTLLLVTAVAAVWISYFRYGGEIPRLEQEVEEMRRMTRELIIEDPWQVAVVMRQELWYDEPRWDIHLPDGEFVIRLATREIGKDGLAPVLAESRIDGGRHQIELRKSEGEDGWEFVVLVDDKTVIDVSEKPDWQTGRVSEGSGEFATGTQLSPNMPVVLFRRRVLRATKMGTYEAPTEPTMGLMLWIERVDR